MMLASARFSDHSLRQSLRSGRVMREAYESLQGVYAQTLNDAQRLEQAGASAVQYHFVPAMLEDHGRTRVKGHGFSCHACVLRPESRGSVTLASADAAAAPRIDPGFLTDDRDRSEE